MIHKSQQTPVRPIPWQLYNLAPPQRTQLVEWSTYNLNQHAPWACASRRSTVRHTQGACHMCGARVHIVCVIQKGSHSKETHAHIHIPCMPNPHPGSEARTFPAGMCQQMSKTLDASHPNTALPICQKNSLIWLTCLTIQHIDETALDRKEARLDICLSKLPATAARHCQRCLIGTSV